MRGIQLLYITDDETEEAVVLWSQTLAAQGIGGLDKHVPRVSNLLEMGRKHYSEQMGDGDLLGPVI